MMIAHRCFDDPHMQELRVWCSFIHLPHRQIHDCMSLISKCLLYLLKKLSLPGVLFCMTQQYCAFW